MGKTDPDGSDFPDCQILACAYRQAAQAAYRHLHCQASKRPYLSVFHQLALQPQRQTTEEREKPGVKISVLVPTPLPPGTLLHLQLDLVDLLWAISDVWPVTNTISIPWEILRNAHFPRSTSDLL